MKTCLLIILIFFIPKAQAEFYSLDRYCPKQIDQLRLFYVNGMFTSSDDFRKNLAWLDNFQKTKLGKYLKGREPTGSYNKDEDLHMQIYEVVRKGSNLDFTYQTISKFFVL